jgi:hypothetical protein
VTLQTILTVAQILFYLSAIAVAWLTFTVARRGLLSPVNTEYQKRVMDRLAQLAEELWAEFDPTSERFGVGVDPNMLRVLRGVNEEYVAERDGSAPPDFPVHNIVHSESSRLRDLKDKLEADPFLPAHIRTAVSEYLEKRSMAIDHAQINCTDYWWRALRRDGGAAEGLEALNKYEGVVQGEFVRSLTKRGWDFEQSRDHVRTIRLQIQQYLQRYDPSG